MNKLPSVEQCGGRSLRSGSCTQLGKIDQGPEPGIFGSVQLRQVGLDLHRYPSSQIKGDGRAGQQP